MEFNLRIPNASQSKFTSVFRLDGVPILPPLMTAEKRRQMQYLREKAIEVENKQKEKEAIIVHRQSQLKLNEKENEQNNDADQEVSNRSSEYDSTLKSMENSYMLLSMMVIDSENDKKQETQKPNKSKLATEREERGHETPKLMKSDTIIYDNITNSVIVPMSSTSSKTLLLQQQQKIPAINIDPPTPLVATRNFSDNLDTSCVESIECASDDLSQDECKSWFENNAIHMKRSATSPSLKGINTENTCSSEPINTADDNMEPYPLVRSNSFTVAYPSKVLLEHMERQFMLQDDDKQQEQQTQEQLQQQQEIHTPKKKDQQQPQKTFITRSAPSSSITRDTIESKAKRVQKSMTKQPRGNSNIKPSSIEGKSKRSPYEQMLGVKLKSARILKNNVKAKTTQSQHLIRKQSKTNQNSVGMPDIPQNSALEIQCEQRQKFLQLLAQQQEQQRIMQQNFEMERNYLLQELSQDTTCSKISDDAYENLCSAINPNHNNNVKCVENNQIICAPFVQTKPPISPLTRDFSESSSLGNGNSMSQLFVENVPPPLSTTRHVCGNTPRRRLFGPDLSPLGLSPRYVNQKSVVTPSPSSSFSLGRRLDIFDKGDEIRTLAATKINACVRGYLTRRLFRTEHVQRICTTIKDTLFFVLGLHMEARENPQEGNKLINIQLKTRLLQQLISATKTLHMVFFETTIKERLEIISRDRKRLKIKLNAEMSKQRSPRKSPAIQTGLRA